jgi:ribosome biogenesis GTPase A
MDLNKELEKELLVGYKKIKNIINLREVVLVVGNTGVAKSTIIAYLMGAELEEHTLGITKQQVLRIKGDSEKYPIINSNPGIRSQTLYPEIFSAGNGINFCDFPGFYETRGVQHKVTQAVSLECILRSKTYKKLVVVCTYEEIQNLVGFATLMSDIDSRFGKGTANSVFLLSQKLMKK